MLRGRAEVRELALSDASGRGSLYVPISDEGKILHLAGSLKPSASEILSRIRSWAGYTIDTRESNFPEATAPGLPKTPPAAG